MKRTCKNTFVAALALTACVAIPVALTACGGADNENGNANGDVSTVTFDAFGYLRSNAARLYIGSVVFNAELKYVGDQAFYNCQNMLFVSMNDGHWHFGADGKPTVEY